MKWNDNWSSREYSKVFPCFTIWVTNITKRSIQANTIRNKNIESIFWICLLKLWTYGNLSLTFVCGIFAFVFCKLHCLSLFTWPRPFRFCINKIVIMPILPFRDFLFSRRRMYHYLFAKKSMTMTVSWKYDKVVLEESESKVGIIDDLPILAGSWNRTCPWLECLIKGL